MEVTLSALSKGKVCFIQETPWEEISNGTPIKIRTLAFIDCVIGRRKFLDSQPAERRLQRSVQS